jgi:hypothetical protein
VPSRPTWKACGSSTTSTTAATPHRIRSQTFSFTGVTGDYARDVAPARTFSLKEEAEGLWAMGMCRHLSPKDVLVIGDEGPIDNAYRFDDEPVRHKVLDAIGDLTLVGCAVQCKVLAVRSGPPPQSPARPRRSREQMQAIEVRQTMLDGRVMGHPGDSAGSCRTAIRSS